MILSPLQEEFMRKFLARQREIGKDSLETTTLLAKSNIKSILISGLQSPPTIERMEEVLEEFKQIRAEEEKLEKSLGYALDKALDVPGENDGEGQT